MISEDEAKAMVLRVGEDRWDGLRLAIQSCVHSPRGDYWVICANSENFVLHGDWSSLLVGVSGYLINAESGELTVVGSGQSLEIALQDMSDKEAAGSLHYVLQPAFDRSDKAALINLRQHLQCPLRAAIALLSADHRNWLVGDRRLLISAQTVLGEKHIETEISLQADPGGAAVLQHEVTNWDALVERMHVLLGGLCDDENNRLLPQNPASTAH